MVLKNGVITRTTYLQETNQEPFSVYTVSRLRDIKKALLIRSEALKYDKADKAAL